MAPTPGRPAQDPASAQPSEALAQIQDDEREVLKAIYMDDYEEVEAKGSWGVRNSSIAAASPVILRVDYSQSA